jgi:hypothetical protein
VFPRPRDGAFFANQGTRFNTFWRDRGTGFINGANCQNVTNVTKWALEQCRGASLNGA